MNEESAPKGGPLIQAAARTYTTGSSLGDAILILPRRPEDAAHALVGQLGGAVFAWRWAKAVIEDLS
jgi:hypothetical protein